MFFKTKENDMTTKNKIVVIAVVIALIASLSSAAVLLGINNTSGKIKDFSHGVFLRGGGFFWKYM
jgi:hypothetical protein